MKNLAWITTMDAYIKIYELAKSHGKIPGDNMQAEFETIFKKYPNEFTFLNETNKDVDLLSGDLREEGIKVLNPKEIDRRKR